MHFYAPGRVNEKLRRTNMKTDFDQLCIAK
jgi:hypothetical protein